MQCSNMSYNKATTPPKSIVLNELFYSLADASDCCGECGDHCRHCNQKMITVTMIALVFCYGGKTSDNCDYKISGNSIVGDCHNGTS